MWYTKNNLRIAQTQLQIKIVPDDKKPDEERYGWPSARFNHYASKINSNLNNIPFLKSLLKKIEGDTNTFYGADKQILFDKIKELTSPENKADTQGTTGTQGTLNVDNITTTISNFLIPKDIQSYNPSVIFSEGNYFVLLKLQTNQPGAPILPYSFNFKTQEELTERLNSVADYMGRSAQSQSGQPSQNLSNLEQQQQQSSQQNSQTNNVASSDLAKQIKGTENKAQELKLLSPTATNGYFQFHSIKDSNAYNELVNNLILNITVTPNDSEKYFRTINATPQLNNPNISSNAKNTINEMIEMIKNEAIYQLAKDDTGKLIPATALMSNFEPTLATNYQPVAFPIEVPAARDGAVDIFIDGQKIASVKNNTQFTLNTQKYPLFSGSHTLEAKVAGMMNTPEPPISDRFLKVLSKVRKFDFTLMNDGSIKFQNTSNDIESYKPALNYLGEGLASKAPVNTVNLLADQQSVILEPDINNYLTLLMTNSKQKMPEIINNWKQKLRALSMEQYNDKETRRQILRTEIIANSDQAPKTKSNDPAPDNTPPPPPDTPTP